MMATTPPKPPVPPEVAALYAQAAGLHARVTKFRRPLTSTTIGDFHRWESEAKPVLAAIGVASSGEADERLVHLRASLSAYLKRVEADFPVRKRRASPKRKGAAKAAPKKPAR